MSSNYRECFYCKQSFQTNYFPQHLKECNARRNRKPPQVPGPAVQNVNVGQAKPASNALPPWNCPMCSFSNQAACESCTMCQRGKRPQSGAGGAQSVSQYWQCQSCTFVNSALSMACKICNNGKPNSGGGGSSSSGSGQPKVNNNNNGRPPQQMMKMRMNQAMNPQQQIMGRGRGRGQGSGGQQRYPSQMQQQQQPRQMTPLQMQQQRQRQMQMQMGRGRGAQPNMQNNMQNNMKNMLNMQNNMQMQGRGRGRGGLPAMHPMAGRGFNPQQQQLRNNSGQPQLQQVQGRGRGRGRGAQQQPQQQQMYQQQRPPPPVNNSMRINPHARQAMNQAPSQQQQQQMSPRSLAKNNPHFGGNNNNNNPPLQQRPQSQQQQKPQYPPPPSSSSPYHAQNNNKPPQHQQQQQPQQMSGGANGNSHSAFGSRPPPVPAVVPPSSNEAYEDPEEASLRLIRQMMEAELCALCHKQQGFPMSCHNVCGSCIKKYLLKGIVQQKWKKQNLKCPVVNCNTVMPEWIVKQSGLGPAYQQQIEEMQKTYLVASDPSMAQCPKCHETFICETGDMSSVNHKEKGLDGKPLSDVAQRHKAQYRFRCSNKSCKTIFCSGCQGDPYHLGYTCEQWEVYQNAKKCRFCESQLDMRNTAPNNTGLGPGLVNVCNSAECLEKKRWSCDKILGCGHACIGLRGHPCLKCMNVDCIESKDATNDNDFCNICWVDPLRACPSLKLSCGHFFHFMCVWQKIDRKWPAARITFGFLNCPLCKSEIRHPALTDITQTYYDLKSTIQKDAIERVKIEGLERDKRLLDSKSKYHNNLPLFAMDRLAFYPCSKCKKPYFGGMKACEEAGLEMEEKYKTEHLVCGSCSSGPNSKACKRHGKKYITYKCKFCCSIGSWYCWGSTHFCDGCHKKQEKGDYLNRKPVSDLPKCPGKALCPLGIEHPANGTSEFSLGCVVCLRK